MIKTSSNDYLYNSKYKDAIASNISIQKLNDDRFLVRNYINGFNVNEQIIYIVDSKTFETKALYSALRHKVIPIFSEKRYINDEEYKRLSNHDKYKKRFNDTYERKVYDYINKLSEIKSNDAKESIDKGTEILSYVEDGNTIGDAKRLVKENNFIYGVLL